MNSTNSIRCTTCGASVELADTALLHCPQCGTAALVPEALRRTRWAYQLVQEHAAELAEVLDTQVRRNQTIEALHLLRKLTGLSFLDCRAIVAAVAEGYSWETALARTPLAGGAVLPPAASGAPDAGQFEDVQQALAVGNKLEAIKRYRQRTGAGLAESKDVVELLAAQQRPAAPPTPAQVRAALALGPADLPSMARPVSEADLAEVRHLWQENRKIEAIKLYRECSGLGLAEARDAVEALTAKGVFAPPLDALVQPEANLSEADLAEIRRLMARGQKIEAIKLYRQRCAVGLKEAKYAVEALGRGEAPPAWHSSTPPAVVDLQGLSPADLAEIRRLAAQGHKIEAFKLYRQRSGLGLKESLAAVEALSNEELPSAAPLLPELVTPVGEGLPLRLLLPLLVIGLVILAVVLIFLLR